jgi:hypothetical protein
MACERDDALLRRVDPTERCLFAILITNIGQIPNRTNCRLCVRVQLVELVDVLNRY